ncbi:MAG: hypothetical protein QOH39_824 [Verrucomicrobiota bacterium]|jgi:hypothetical protein
MNDNRRGAIALILGALSGIITLSLHPTGGAHHVTPAQFEMLIALVIGVHALAIVGLPFSFIGALALSRRIDSPSRTAIMALVIYGFSLVAVMAAATMSGLVTPDILRQMVGQSPARDQWRILMDYNHLINQGFAQINAVGSCVAIVLWSAVIVKRRELALPLGIYGLVLGPVIIGTMFAGGLKLDVHGFGLITFSQAAWFIVAGVLLWRSEGDQPRLATQR